MSRCFPWIVFFAALSSAPLPGAEIKSVETVYRSEDSFIRISEYLNGERLEGPEVTARTHPDHRAGLYFRVVLAHPVAESGAMVRAEVSVLTADDPEPAVFLLEWPDATSRSSVLLLGLTGEDWPENPEAPHPTAWRVRLLDARQEVVAEWRSFLWGAR